MSNFTKITLLAIVLFGCNNTQKVSDISVNIPEGMVWVESKSFLMGGKDSDNDAMMRTRTMWRMFWGSCWVLITQAVNLTSLVSFVLAAHDGLQPL